MSINPQFQTYRLLSFYHLGDRWARLNCVLRRIEAGEDIALYLPDPNAYEILTLLDIGALCPHVLSIEPLNGAADRTLIHQISGGTAAYECRYFPTKKCHCVEARTIGLALSANWRSEEKIPPGLDEAINALRSALPAYQFITLGKPHQDSVSEVVDVLSRLTLLISVDNGIAHVARSVGVPHFLIEYLLPVSRGFPQAVCDYTLVTQDTLVERVVSYISEATKAIPAES